MKKLLRAAQIVLLPLHLLASNQIFEAGSMVRLADTSAGINEAYWLFDSSSHYFGHYPSQAATAQGYSSYFEDGSYALNSLGNNQLSAQLNSTVYGTNGSYGYPPAVVSRAASIELTSPFSATYSGALTQSGISIPFNGNLTIYPAQDYAPEVLPIDSAFISRNAYYYSVVYSGSDEGTSITVLSDDSVQMYDPEEGLSTGSYTYIKLGPNLGRISISDSPNYLTLSATLFFKSPTEVYFYGNSSDYDGSYTDWGALDVTYPLNYSLPEIFPAPSTLPQNQILQITGTNSDLSLDLAGGTWTDASVGSGSFTYTYAVQSGGVAGLTLNRTGQNAPSSPEHFALRFTSDGVGDVVYSSLDGSQSFNLVAAPTWEPYDNFSGNTIDTQKWETWYWPGGQAPFISNGQLRLGNGGGSVRKDAEFMSKLQSAGIDVSSKTNHSGVAFTDPSIIGIEADLSLPAGVASDSGVIMELFEQVSPQEIRAAGVDLGFWGGSQADLEFNKRAYSSGSKTSEVYLEEYATLGQSYRIRILRQDGSIKLYRDDVLVQTHAAEGELLAFFIGAFNDEGRSMYATVDNVRVLRDTTIAPSLPVVESYGNTYLLEDSSGYYAGSADTPLLYYGLQLSSSYPGGAYTVLGVDLVNGAYRMVLSIGGQYYVMNFALNGSNSSAMALVSDIQAEETNLQQDLDNDGRVGWKPPVSIVGKSYVLTALTGVMKSVPDQGTYTSNTLNYGFSGNLMASVSYNYSDGTLTYGNEERIDFIFTSATGGTYAQGYFYEGIFYVENTGTFEETNISLSLQTNWQRSETMDIELSTQYWQVETLIGDSVVYNNGKLNFIFDSGVTGYYEDQEIEIDYAGVLPLDEDWQVVLNDIYVGPSLSNFKVELDLEIGYDFECELFFEDNGFGRQFEVKIMDSTYLPNGVEYPSAYVTANQDTRISSGGDMRIVHVASSRDLIFEYQPDGASDWTELARFNFANGEFQSQYKRNGSNLTGGLISPTDNRSRLEIEGYASIATQVGDLSIGGIEIGNYTPPVEPLDSIAGMQFEYTSADNVTSVPLQEFYGSDGVMAHGFSDSITERNPYTYSDGVISFPEWSEEIRLTFTDANSGTYAFVELYGGGPMGGEVDDSGTFVVVTPSLEEKTDWQHTETFDSGFSTDYWNIFHDTEDRVEVASGALNFIFAGAGEGVPEPDPTLYYDDYEIEIDYGRTLPMDESWQIVMDDVYGSSSLDDFEFDLELEFEGQGYNFECGFDFEEEDFGVNDISVSFLGDTYSGFASVSTVEDSRIQSNVSLRITHNANSRELVFQYQPNGANAWSELARLNLGSGDFSGLNSNAVQGNGELIGTSQRVAVSLEVEAEETTQVGDIRIGGIEISSYTPPPPPASPESLVGYKLVGQFTEGTSVYRHDFFFTGAATLQGHYFVESNDPSIVDDWSEETYTYLKTGATTGTLAITNSSGETTDVVLTFDSATSGTAIANSRNGIRPNSASGPFTFIEYDPNELPEPPLPVVESYGNTDLLLEDSSGYYAGSADTPLLYYGLQLSSSYPGGAYTVLGVDLVNGAYRMVLSNGGQYYVMNFALNGSNSSAMALVSDIQAEELKLQQDFDGDGHTGPPPIDPPVSLEGKAYQMSIGGDGTLSVPLQLEYDSATYNEGFAGSLIDINMPYTYANGVVTHSDGSEIRLTFTSATEGTFEYWHEGLELGSLGTFIQVTPSLEQKTDWQRTENFDSPLSNDYWQVWRRSVDSLASNPGELNFLFADGGEGNYPDISVPYGRTLPMNDDWQIVLDDAYAVSTLNNFEVEFYLNLEKFKIAFAFADYGSEGSGAREVNVWLEQQDILGGLTTASAYVSANQDPRIQSNVSLRVLHTANGRELSFEYQPGEASTWTELARLNLETGVFTSSYLSNGEGFSGQLISSSERLPLEIIAEAGESTQTGDLSIAGIYISNYTPPPTPVDTDGDGLDDSVETNTGIYMSLSDTGTDPNNADSSGDGLFDGAVVSAGFNPNVDYSSLIAIVPNSTVDMNLRSLRLERAENGAFNMNFDLEMSTDLETWSRHTSHSLDLIVPDQSKTFMRLNVK